MFRYSGNSTGIRGRSLVDSGEERIWFWTLECSYEFYGCSANARIGDADLAFWDSYQNDTALPLECGLNGNRLLSVCK